MLNSTRAMQGSQQPRRLDLVPKDAPDILLWEKGSVLNRSQKDIKRRNQSRTEKRNSRKLRGVLVVDTLRVRNKSRDQSRESHAIFLKWIRQI